MLHTIATNVRSASGTTRWLALVAFLTIILAGPSCESPTTSNRRTGADLAGVRADYRPEVVRATVIEYAIDFAATVETMADHIIENTDDSDQQRDALRWKLNAIPAARQASFRSAPLAALFDMWVLVVQQEAFFDGGAGAHLFGPHQAQVITVSQDLQTKAEDIWRSLAVSDAHVEEWRRTQIEPWVAANPITDLSFARSSTIGKFTEFAPSRGGTLQSVRNLDEQLAILSAQARIVLAGLHKQIRGETELVLRELVELEQLQQAAEDLETIDAGVQGMNTSLAEMSTSLAEATAVAEETHDFVRAERATVVEEVDRQVERVLAQVGAQREAIVDAVIGERTEIVNAVSAEREAILEAVAEELAEMLKTVSAERTVILEGVDEQRLETLTWVQGQLAAERQVIVDELDRMVTESLEEGERTARTLVNMITLRVLGLVAAGLFAAPLVAHAYVRVWPRR